MSESQKIMVVFDRPKQFESSDAASAVQAWLGLADCVQGSTTLPTKGSRRLGENVFLLDADGALPSILQLLALAKSLHLQCSAFLVPGDLVELSVKPAAPVAPNHFNDQHQ